MTLHHTVHRAPALLSPRQREGYAGRVIATEHGLLRTAVAAGMDDYGAQLMRTADGLCVPCGRTQYRHVGGV